MRCEGSIFIAGAARGNGCANGIKVIKKGRAQAVIWRLRPIRRRTCISCPLSPGSARRTGTLRRAARSTALTRNTGPAEFARAALEAVCYQTRDLLDAMHKDWKSSGTDTVLRVDGGMVASDWTTAAAVGHPRRTGRPADDPRNHGAGRCLACGSTRRRLAQTEGLRQGMGARHPVQSRRWTTRPAPRNSRAGATQCGGR